MPKDPIGELIGKVYVVTNRSRSDAERERWSIFEPSDNPDQDSQRGLRAPALSGFG